MADSSPATRPRRAPKAPRCSPREAERHYHVAAWGDGYFFVNAAGHVAVRPVWNDPIAIDLHDVVEQLKARRVTFPALLRFQDLLHARVVRLNEAFRQAIAAQGYGNHYQGVFPIKVNQLREVVEEVLEAGRPYRHGLECGSKSELVATLPYLEDDALLLCNGYKDAVMLRLMLAGQQLGQDVLPIVERYEEFEMLRALGKELRQAPRFGVRVRLTTTGAGLWAESGGANSKFGLSLTEVLRLAGEVVGARQPLGWHLLHFHLGSQIADLDTIRQAAEEGARVYAALRKRGVEIAYVDVGGGLGVSYEAGNPTALGRIDYALEDYCHTVVEALGRVCADEGVPPPVIVSESGRAVTAHHSALVVEVAGMRARDQAEPPALPTDDHALLEELRYLRDHLQDNAGSALGHELEEAYEAAGALRDRAQEAFRAGHLSLAQRAAAEGLYGEVARAVLDEARALAPEALPPTLAALDRQFYDHYLCNFSVFRSLPDYWAIGQRFPIMPLHRLREAPTRRGILVDLTCDSDGKINAFVSPEGDQRFLPLHPKRPDEPYYLGIFLMGAYQDIMGDMHNLFGHPPEVHIYADADEPGNFYIEKILPGTSVADQLRQVQYHPNDLERRMSERIQARVKAGLLRPKEGVRLLDQYRRAFEEPTYLRPEAT